MRLITVLLLASWGLGADAADSSTGTSTVPCLSVYERALHQRGDYDNPYVAVTATVRLSPPGGGAARRLPLFWDGADIWKFRFAPDQPGRWTWMVESNDAGLDRARGEFDAGAAAGHGSIMPMRDHPRHFQTQDGLPFWFMGDTAWALYTSNADEQLSRKTALRYVDRRAAEGFNVLHSMLMSEAGWGNEGGPPFADIAHEQINPEYWREVDTRLVHVNRAGVIAGLALAWGNKGRGEPYAWNRFASLAAQRRYVRYIVARYSAFNVYFIVAGEWHAEIRTTKGATEDSVRARFVALGEELRTHDPHQRMIAIHPMTATGSVREFVTANWMSFGDYQQNYRELHARILQSRRAALPVVNSEYGYFLRDQDGDGTPDKSNSMSADAMRFASWDIVMAGGYLVTGFGTTYFGGNRDPGPFDVAAEKNVEWAKQLGALRTLFTSLDWWRLQPADQQVTAALPRGRDRTVRLTGGRGRGRTLTAPPDRTYWLLADAGRTMVAYVRGSDGAVQLHVGLPGRHSWSMRQFDPRTGRWTDQGTVDVDGVYQYQPPDQQDWVLVLSR